MRSTIICVDDEKMLLNMLYGNLESWFGKHYYIEKAPNAAEALKILDNCLESGRDISVFISDYIMPIMKGDELLSIVKQKDPRIKRIMLTGYSAIDGIVNAINKAGIYRYISKPWDNKDLMLTLLEAIKSYEQEKVTSELSRNYELLYYRYEKLYKDGDQNYTNLLKSFGLASDLRSEGKEKHSERVADYSKMLGEALKLDEDKLKILEQAAFLHDSGKIMMTDEELEKLKKTKKYSEDFKSIRFFQANFSERILQNFTSSSEFFENIKYQFETFDGSGPFGLKGEEIPIGARIIHIANLYDNVALKMRNASIKEKVVEFVTQGNKYLDNHLTSEFIKQLKLKEE